MKVAIAGTGVATIGSIPDRLQVVEPANEITGLREEVFSAQLVSLNFSAVGLNGEEKLKTITDVQKQSTGGCCTDGKWSYGLHCCCRNEDIQKAYQ
jgi:hypothetical protein